MKISKRTFDILRNFTMINPSIVFKPGETVATISTSKSVMARAKVDTTFDTTFAIAELSKFLGALTLFEEPELNVTSSAVEIRSGNQKMLWTLSEPSLIKAPPEKEIVLPSTDVSFELKNDMLQSTIKAMAVIDAPELVVTGEDGTIYLEALDIKNPGKSTYRVEVGKTDKKFRFFFMAENIKLQPGDYNVSISARGLSHFSGEDIDYWVAVEQHSTYEG